MNGQNYDPIWITLEEIENQQLTMRIQVDNTTAASLANKTLKQKRSKPKDINFYLL